MKRLEARTERIRHHLQRSFPVLAQPPETPLVRQTHGGVLRRWRGLWCGSRARPGLGLYLPGG
jgi:hypothetical protein